MGTWFEIEKTNEGVDTFLNCNGWLHDYRLEKFSYTPEHDLIELFLRYDSRKEGVLLRFVELQKVHIHVEEYYPSHWIGGCGCFLTDQGTLIWQDETDYETNAELKEHFDSSDEYLTWIEAGRIFWTLTDGDGNPTTIPDSYIDQTWIDYDKEEHHHFDLKVFTGNWDVVLNPYTFGRG